MQVLALTLGTRGDVQPFVALGRELQSRGHRMTICTSSSFRGFIVAHGVGYAYMDDCFAELLDSVEGRQTLETTRNLWQMFTTYLRLMRRVAPMQRRVFADTWAAVQDTAPDCIIAHPKTAWAIDFAEKLDVPVAMTAFQPVLVPTGAFPFMAFPQLKLGAAYNRMSYRLVHAAIRGMEGRHVKRWRQAEGLGPRRRGTGLLDKQDGTPVPVLHAFSEKIVPTPDDWPEYARPTGYWFLDEPDDWQPPRELEAFLEAGDPPVYVGFGSMAGRDPERIGTIVHEAIELAGVRAIVATGSGGIAALGESPQVLQVDTVPHDWLLHRVAAVVHHGGAGTTAAGLRAGRPTVVCPVFGDQPFWARRVTELGAGCAPIPWHKLTAERLAEALRLVTSDSGIRARAGALGEALRNEHGTARAADRLNELCSACKRSRPR